MLSSTAASLIFRLGFWPSLRLLVSPWRRCGCAVPGQGASRLRRPTPTCSHFTTARRCGFGTCCIAWSPPLPLSAAVARWASRGRRSTSAQRSARSCNDASGDCSSAPSPTCCLSRVPRRESRRYSRLRRRGAIFALEVPYQDDFARRMLLPALVSSGVGLPRARRHQRHRPTVSGVRVPAVLVRRPRGSRGPRSGLRHWRPHVRVAAQTRETRVRGRTSHRPGSGRRWRDRAHVRGHPWPHRPSRWCSRPATASSRWALDPKRSVALPARDPGPAMPRDNRDRRRRLARAGCSFRLVVAGCVARTCVRRRPRPTPQLAVPGDRYRCLPRFRIPRAPRRADVRRRNDRPPRLRRPRSDRRGLSPNF